MNKNVLTAEMKEFLTISPTPKVQLKHEYLITVKLLDNIRDLKNLKKSKISQIFENVEECLMGPWNVEVQCICCGEIHIEEMSKREMLDSIKRRYPCEECIQKMQKEGNWNA